MASETTEPNDALQDYEWLTDANDAEVGMGIAIGDSDPEEFEITEISRDEVGTVLKFTVTQTRALTAREINDRDDTIVF